MPRVKAVNTPSDYPGTPDEATLKDLKEFFDHLFPGSPNPQIDKGHVGLAVAAHNPKLALNLAKMSRFCVLEMPWSRRRDLLELAIQALNLHFRCQSSFEAHVPIAKAHGISGELIAAIPYWRTSALFTAEQRLVIEYTYAVVAGEVAAELFSRVVEQYGERGAVEFTAAVAWFSFWAMVLNATGS